MTQGALSPFTGPSDLHLHSNHSDGTATPAEVVRQAHAHGIRTLALTDHDRTTGWVEAGDAAVALGMTFLPGIELSARHDWRSVHMLGYLFDPADPALVAETDRIRVDRFGRAERIVRNIARDYDLDWLDVIEQTTQDATVGRPHIADALVARGIVHDRSGAHHDSQSCATLAPVSFKRSMIIRTKIHCDPDSISNDIAVRLNK